MKLLEEISDKLIKLAEEEEDLYPEFYTKERNYIIKRAKTLMSQEVAGLGAQPQRDAECERIMNESTESQDYHEVYPRMQVHDRLTKIYLQLAWLVNKQ